MAGHHLLQSCSGLLCCAGRRQVQALGGEGFDSSRVFGRRREVEQAARRKVFGVGVGVKAVEILLT